MASQPPITLETAILWARSGRESNKVYRFLFLHPDDFFTIPQQRAWSIAHQVVYNGAVDLLTRILALYSDDQIDIRTLSRDRKTLLDVAIERQAVHKEMFDYIEHLFLQDDLIQAAKQSDWRLVSQILQNNPKLANEKPPYSTFFLLHYIIQDGDQKILEDFLRRFQFDTNIFSADRETPLDLARRLKKENMCSILEPTTNKRTDLDVSKSEPSLPVNDKPTSSASSQLPYPKIDPFPTVDLQNTSITITEKGDYILEKTSFLTVTQICLPSLEPQTQSTIESMETTEEKDNQYIKPTSKPEPDTPITPATKSQLLKQFKCPLTQTIMVDPVIASDGQTYERKAILKYISIYHCSPITGVPMDATVKNNAELQQLIQSMRK